MLLVQNTREIAKVAPKHNEKELATEYFERRRDIHFFTEKLHDGKEQIFANLMILQCVSIKLF